ncbi:hypothetical protein CASFOL_036427 [Castilleja foliolosa]|uniref:Uncharacterized protein n=1 Tax=Castilleja foliolosa TaxID=1961234 RepID=A0ABD3BVJ9_9LAMI
MENMDNAELYCCVLTVNYAPTEGIKGGEQGWSPNPQFTRIEKGASSEMELEDQESCVPPVSIAAQDSRDDLLPEKIVQGTQAPREEMMDTVNHGAALDEKSSEKK